MKIKPDFDIDKWCIYNEKKFKLELKADAPEEIKKKFNKWQQAYIDGRYFFDEVQNIRK